MNIYTFVGLGLDPGQSSWCTASLIVHPPFQVADKTLVRSTLVKNMVSHSRKFLFKTDTSAKETKSTEGEYSYGKGPQFLHFYTSYIIPHKNLQIFCTWHKLQRKANIITVLSLILGWFCEWSISSQNPSKTINISVLQKVTLSLAFFMENICPPFQVFSALFLHEYLK